tara:strand:+ start:833 stop:1180 length:348 start_codon:yes stop_codon:yes gene_type:complete
MNTNKLITKAFEEVHRQTTGMHDVALTLEKHKALFEMLEIGKLITCLGISPDVIRLYPTDANKLALVFTRNGCVFTRKILGNSYSWETEFDGVHLIIEANEVVDLSGTVVQPEEL